MSKNEHLFPYEWRFSDGYPSKGIKHHGCKVFGTFICGGGSTMGYKLAGYDHFGGVELDPKVAAVYKANHHPQHLYIEDIRDFNKRDDLPAELYQLDLLDGSPPCSTFSTAGSREKAWGKEKHFAEGQKLQRLDDLVFVYCDTIEKLKPKVCLLENVSGLVKGNGKVYAKEICKRITEIGYRVQVFLLNASTMGVPQKRERCFFIGLRNDLKFQKLVLNFDESPILFKQIKDETGREISGKLTRLTWENRKPFHKTIGDTNFELTGKKSNFNTCYAHDEEVLNTITASAHFIHYSKPLMLSDDEIKKASTFPLDYKTSIGMNWLAGMSVPPVMTAQIANQIYLQWLCKLK
jgi:DNA (cytosine-5)-methyltransferase 1